MASFNINLAKPLEMEDTTPTYSTGERWEAALELGNMDTAAELFGWRTLDKLLGNEDPMEYMRRNDPIGELSPEELNKRFPNMEKPFTKPTSYLVANELHERATKKRKLESIVSMDGKIDQGFWSLSTLGEVAQHATDPFEIGADIAMTLSTAGIGAAISKGAKLVKSAGAASKLEAVSGVLKANTFTKNAVEGVAANAALETAIYGEKQDLNEDYQLRDAVMSTLVGGLAFPALMHGGAAAWKYTANNMHLSGAVFKQGYSKFLEGKNSSLKFFKDAKDSLFKASPKLDTPDFRQNFNFKTFDQVDLKTESLFVARRRPVDGDLNTNHIPTGDNFGEDGIHLSTNPQHAYATATKLNDADGDVLEFLVEVDQSKLLDLDAEVDMDTLIAIKETFKDVDIDESIIDAKTFKEVFDSLRTVSAYKNADMNEVSLKINQIAKNAGYEGYVSLNEAGNGHDLFIFDNNKLKEKARHEASSDKAGDIDPEIIKNERANAAKEETIFSSPSAKKEINDTVAPSPEKVLLERKQQYESIKQDLEKRMENKEATQGDLEIKKEIDTSEALDDGEIEILTDVINCFEKAGT